MSSTDVVRIAQQGPVAEEEQGRLKADLHFRRRGLLKSPSEIAYQGRKCARCSAPFGRFYNTGTLCARCRHKICKQCRVEVGSSKDNKEVEWICNVCYKIAGLHVATGNWIFDPVSGECINEKTSSSPVEILKHSIRRAWTINGAPTCWSATRKSPELRIYRSLPSRHQEYRETSNKSELRKIASKEIFNSDVQQGSTPRVDEQIDENYVPHKSDIHRDPTITNEEVVVEKSSSRIDINERTDAKRNDKSPKKSEEEIQCSDIIKQKKGERCTATTSNKIKLEDQEDASSIQEQTTPRLSLIKPPRILAKFISPDIKSTQSKHGERKSNIPIFRRSSKEFEDIRSPQESPKRSLIPQRYRGSTDDLRRSREDISVPSLIPKLLSPRNKEDRLKRHDSKDDVRTSLKSSRRDSKDESKGLSCQSTKEDTKHGIRIFRRDNSREDVGRDSANLNANTGSVAGKGKSSEKQEVAEDRVGVATTSKSKSTIIEQSRTKLPATESKESLDNNCSRESEDILQPENHESVGSQVESTETMFDVIIANENNIEEQENVIKIDRDENDEHTAITRERKNSVGREELENNKNIDAMKETTESFLNTTDTDITIGGNDQKSQSDLSCGRKWDDFQVIRRKFSKEEFSNADDTDETPNKRCSSHLSPEASPLSTRSSRYSPRESESEPTPALPRKTSDSCSASQRIRDAITRTRRESNSSARYESSGSESVRLSETGLHGYVELARKVKFFGGIGSGAVPSTIGSDEVVQRDSATSAGEDEPRDDNHSRAGPISSQGRSMLRRRRQFDAQGSRRRGRSHARSCYAEELQGFQALHVIGRDDRQHSPTGNQGQDQPIVDYRRLVFISSDSSSGREEDDADSSCSSSSYLNGLPRSGNHAQSLEDCDWDYFESGSLPLPPGVPVAFGTGNVGTDSSVTQDWSCCPGRGSAACQACGGSRGANVLPVPVPIPVPVPYPVPVPAALWTSDFAAAASSMISRTTEQGEPGTLRLRGDPAAPWFAWHPRFNQPLHGARLDPRITDAFDPATCTFRTDQILATRFYGSDVGTSPIPSAESYHRLNSLEVNRDEKDNAVTTVTSKHVEACSSLEKPEVDTVHDTKASEHSDMKIRETLEETNMVRAEKSNEKDEKTKETEENQEVLCEHSLTASMERRSQRMYQHSHDDSGSSSGRSSADSSDLDEESSTHRFSRVFVVNDDSLSSDNDVEDNGNEDDSDSANEGGVTLKKVTALPEEEPVVLQYVRALNEDTNFDIRKEDRKEKDVAVESKTYSRNDTSGSGKMSASEESSNLNEKRKYRDRNNGIENESNDKRVLHVLQCRAMSEEIYLAGDNDSSENPVTLKSIKTLDPDSIELPVIMNSNPFSKKDNSGKENDTLRSDQSTATNQVIYNEYTNISLEEKSGSSDTWDSNIIPDSLEISTETVLNGDRYTFENRSVGNVADCDITAEDSHSESSTDKHASLSQIVSEETFDRNDDNEEYSIMSDFNSSVNVTVNMCAPPGTDSSTSTDTTTTGSEVSSDELHEYEVTSSNVSSYRENSESAIPAVNSVTLFRLNEKSEERCSSTKDGDVKNDLENMEDDNTCDETHVTDSSTRWNMQCERSSSEQSPDNSNDEGVVTARAKNDSGVITTEDDDQLTGNLHGKTMITDAKGVGEGKEHQGSLSGMESTTTEYNMGDMISCKIEEILKSAEHGVQVRSAHDAESCAVRGATPYSAQVVGDFCGSGTDGGGSTATTAVVGGGSCMEEGLGGGSTPFRLVERRPSTGKENGFPVAASTTDFSRDAQHFPSTANHNIGNSNSNKYRSLVMITQEASYQPVSVITSDTTTLLQPDEVHTTGQGLAGYFQLALEAVSEQPRRKSGQGPRRPLMVKRLSNTITNQSEPEVDSGLSVGSASESDDVSVKNITKIPNRQENNEELVLKERQQVNEQRDGTRTRVSSQSSDDNSGSGGVVILEEGLADDDSWVEEVSHDEDEPGATTGTEESSEDEANNLGDREEELRGYHRQAIDFTLHTIVEESCEESEAEPSMATGSPSKKQRPPSASELEKYFFFGLGGEGNNSSMGSREVDSLSETSSIYSEGLESLGQDESPCSGQNQERSNNGEGFLNSSRLEKYFLSEFLGFDQDRRDSDGSVGSDSEGRPSPEAQRRKRLVRARGTGRSHSSSLDNLLALTQSSQNLSSQNSLQDLSLNQDAQESQSEGSSTETDGADDGQTVGFGTDGQFDTVKRKKKKPRNLGTQSPRVPDDRNKTPEPIREMSLVGEVVVENEAEIINSEDSERAKTPQPECVLSSTSSTSAAMNTSTLSSTPIDSGRNIQIASGDSLTYNQRTKQQSRDSGFVGSCDDLLQHQKLPDEVQGNSDIPLEPGKDRCANDNGEIVQTNHTSTEEAIGTDKSNIPKMDHLPSHTTLPHLPNASLSRKDSFNNWSSDEETNLMMSKMRQFFKTMVANTNGQSQNVTITNSSTASPAPSPRLPGYSAKARLCAQNRTKPPQLVYFENELTRLMKTVPGIRDEQVREIVEYLSSEDTWSDSYDSSDYTSSDLEGAAGGRRSALQEQISQSCQQIISKFDTTGDGILDKEDKGASTGIQAPCLGRDTAFVYQKLVQSFTKMTGDGVSSDANSTPHSSPPLIAKVMHHIGSRLVALMHEVSEGGPSVQHHSTSWRRYSQHHRTPSSASTTEDDESTSDSTNPPSSTHLQLPRSKSHDPLLLINNHPAASTGQEGEEREASDYERFSWRGSFESALMAADSRTKLSLLACSGDVSAGASASASALAMAAKRRSAGDLLFNPKSFSREQLDRVRSCGSIGGGSGGTSGCGGSIEERIWTNRRRSSVPDANTRRESGASAGDDDTEDELEYVTSESRATTLPRGMQSAMTAATNSLPRLPASAAPTGLTTTSTTSSSTMHKAHSVYHFLPQHSGVKSARYRPPGFARNSNVTAGIGGPKRAVSAPGLQVSGSQSNTGKRDNSRSRRQQAMSLTPDDGNSLSEACSTPIIGAGSRSSSSHTIMDVDDMDPGLHSGHLATRASLSSLGARSDSMASVYSGAGEGRCCRSVVVTGEVEFALQYDYKHLTFEVHVTKCKNLAPVDVKRKRSDPYVKVYLLPDKSKSGKRKTKVKKHTLNPEFNETLKFHMTLSGLETRTLWLTVWHSDMFGRNDFLGEVRMPLENKIFDDPTPKWYPLQERTEPFDDPVAYKGEVIVGLKFVPPDPSQQQDRELGSDYRGGLKSRKNWSRGALHVLVKEARNLQTRAKNSGTCDPFCKSYLLPDKGRSGKQKTGVVRKSGGSPVWGHTFIYKDVSLQELAERGLELTVWDHDRIASNEFLGGVRFSLGTGKHYGKPVDWMDATGRELSLWQSMLERPNFWVEGAVTLRPNLHNHGKNNGS